MGQPSGEVSWREFFRFPATPNVSHSSKRLPDWNVPRSVGAAAEADAAGPAVWGQCGAAVDDQRGPGEVGVAELFVFGVVGLQQGSPRW